MSDIILNNLLTPAILFFVLGMVAAIVKSDLAFPKGLSEALSIYLLIAIGLKGGFALSQYALGDIIRPMLATLLLGCIIPILVLLVLRFISMDRNNTLALAATYGSVSIVTYGAAIAFLGEAGVSYEGYMNAMVVLMESPAIFVSLLMYKLLQRDTSVLEVGRTRMGIVSPSLFTIDKEVLRESLFGKSILLLLGSLLIGLFVGEKAIPTVKPLFMDLYTSVLVLFLLNMGLVAGKRLPEVKAHGVKLIVFAVVTPLLFGCLGILTGHLIGLSIGGMMLMGVLGGSASYIAAPAAIRTSIPDANPSIYLGLALGVTFPMNLIIGIPAYFEIAQWLG